MDLRLLPCLAERRQVLARVAVEHELVLDDLKCVAGIGLVRRKVVLRHRLRQVLAGVHAVVQRVANELAVMKRHDGLQAQCERRYPSRAGERPVRRCRQHGFGP